MFHEISQTYNKFWATYGDWFPSNKETFQYFENNGKIILSDSIEANAYKRIGVSGNEKIENLSKENHLYLERHRNLLLL